MNPDQCIEQRVTRPRNEKKKKKERKKARRKGRRELSMANVPPPLHLPLDLRWNPEAFYCVLHSLEGNLASPLHLGHC